MENMEKRQVEKWIDMENLEDFCISHNYTQGDLLLLHQQQQQQPYTPRSSVLNSVLWCPLRFSHKICSYRLYHQLFVGELMFYLRYLCLISHSGVQHILCCVFALFFVVLCTLCYQCLWTIHLLYSLLFIKYQKNTQQSHPIFKVIWMWKI